jgi:hypothetical protein
MFREIINTVETRPISPKGVFCSGVYYTRDNTYNLQGLLYTAGMFSIRGVSY